MQRMIEIEGVIYNLANLAMASDETKEKVRKFQESLQKVRPTQGPFRTWKERRIYYRRNKAARYQLSNPRKGETDMVYTEDGRALYGKRPL